MYTHTHTINKTALKRSVDSNRRRQSKPQADAESPSLCMYEESASAI